MILPHPIAMGRDLKKKKEKKGKERKEEKRRQISPRGGNREVRSGGISWILGFSLRGRAKVTPPRPVHITSHLLTWEQFAGDTLRGRDNDQR
jgi:hypothetical protein